MNQLHLRRAVLTLTAGGVVAYPTEGVFGLGCIPHLKASVARILTLKQRAIEKGLIVVAANIEQLAEYVDFSKLTDVNPIHDSWPGPVTWLVPAKPDTPFWLTGAHSTLAVRVSAHAVVKALCKEVGPLVSTSANPQGYVPARSSVFVYNYFGNKIDYIFPAIISGAPNPTEIRDALSGKIIRPSPA